MKYGIIGDIHGNLEALRAVIPYVLNLEKIVVLGDITGYGPAPNECCDEVKKLNPIIVAGNHDLASISRKDIEWFNPFAKIAIEWTQRNLTKDNTEWLNILPLRANFKNLIFTHGSLRNYTDEYIFNEREAIASLALLNKEILFVGHTHVPSFFFLKNNIIYKKRLLEDEVIKVPQKSIINPGSVGQPRDFIAKASFGIFDDKNNEFRLFRIPYNIKKTQGLMEEKGFPEYLIKRLEAGR